MAKRGKFDRKRKRRDGDSAIEVAGVRKRDPKGRVKGTTGWERKIAVPELELRYRKSLFPAHKQGLAWRQEAGFPLGVYLLRGDLSQAQFEAGRMWTIQRVNADRLLGLPPRMPRSVDLRGARGAKLIDPSSAPSESEMMALERFMSFDADLRKRRIAQHRALELCLVYEVMGLRAERRSDEGLAEYRPKAIADVLDAVRAWRGF